MIRVSDNLIFNLDKFLFLELDYSNLGIKIHLEGLKTPISHKFSAPDEMFSFTGLLDKQYNHFKTKRYVHSYYYKNNTQTNFDKFQPKNNNNKWS